MRVLIKLRNKPRRSLALARLLLMLSLPCIGTLFIFGNFLGDYHTIFVKRNVPHFFPNSLTSFSGSVSNLTLIAFHGIKAWRDPSNFTSAAKSPPSSETQKLDKCHMPSLQLTDAVMMADVKRPAPLRCPQSPEDWAFIRNGTLIFSQEVRARIGDFFCDLSPLVRPSNDDRSIFWGAKMKNFTNGAQIPSDAFKLECARLENHIQQQEARHQSDPRSQSSRPIAPQEVSYEYSDVLWGVSPHNHQVWRRLKDTKPPKNGLAGLSVVMLGFDSMSRMSWLRRMRATRNYVVDQLGGIELQAYNILGDGTPAALFPMLTGRHELELPESRRNHKDAKPVDSYPWIWKDFAKAGYVTSWADAEHDIAPFNYRLLGFAEPPTDYFARPYFLGIKDNSKRTKHAQHCRGPVPKHQVWFNHIRDLHYMYGHSPKFLMHFFATLSHADHNAIMHCDEDLKLLIQDLEHRGYLNSTILIIFGDHGARFANLRETWAGKFEERLPYMMFRFPPWFEQKYPHLLKNFRANVQSLTTAMDVHETLRDIIKFDGAGEGDIRKRGISLFKRIPEGRDCSHADIYTHWCACLDWKPIEQPGKSSEVISAADVAVRFINSLTERYRDLCAELTIREINFAAKSEANDAVLAFKGAADVDGYQPILDQNTKKRIKDNTVSYQVTFHTDPGNGCFEVTVSHKSGVWSVSEQEISRINAYGNDPECILEVNRQIRQFCYCNQRPQ